MYCGIDGEELEADIFVGYITHTHKHTHTPPPLFTMSTMDVGQELVGVTMPPRVQMCSDTAPPPPHTHTVHSIITEGEL